jgi:hypothetical protein
LLARIPSAHGRLSPCSALFFDMGIWLRVKESLAVRRFPAFAHALEKCVALLFALFAGRACKACRTRTGSKNFGSNAFHMTQTIQYTLKDVSRGHLVDDLCAAFA